MVWDYSVISNTARNYCSMPSTSQLSDDDLLAQVNRYFGWVLPSDLRPMQLKTWYSATLSAGDADYDLKETFYDSYVVLGSLAYVSETSGYKEDKIEVYFEPSAFYEMWPDSKDYTASANRGQPSGVLVYNNELLFRKCPDDTYYLNIQAWRRPLVYKGGVVTETSTTFTGAIADEPEVEEWGNLIALGTAKQVLLELGDDESVQRVEGLYRQELSRINSQTLLWQNQRRPAPKF